MKTAHRHLTALAFGVVTASCCSIASAERQVLRATDVELVHAFAKQVATDHHDICRAMANIGIDYPALVQQALDGNPRAIRLMLSLPWIARFDGAVATSYAITSYKVAMMVGDKKLVAAFDPYQEGVNYSGIRKAFLGYPLGSSSLEVEAEIKRRIPEFWQMITERVEGGAGHPATRSESESEGGDKPQPESEGRSR